MTDDPYASRERAERRSLTDSELAAKLDDIESRLVRSLELLERVQAATETLVAKAKALVELMDDAERNHGSLIGGKTLTAVNELRLELSRWQK
jgi:hypothetical protein